MLGSRRYTRWQWYETDTGQDVERVYLRRETAEKERPRAQAWGWQSQATRLVRRDKDHIDYVVVYQRTPTEAAAATVKRRYAQASEVATSLAQAQRRVSRAFIQLRAALKVAHTATINPIRLEQHVRDATQALIAACVRRTADRQHVIGHHMAARDAHGAIESTTHITQEMSLPTLSTLEEAIASQTRDDQCEARASATLTPALAAQERVVTAARAWQAAVSRRWRAQRAYMPVEGWWATMRARLSRTPRPIPAVALSRRAVLTQSLRSVEVAPDDKAWRQAEEDVAATEAKLVEALEARDQAMAAVVQAFLASL